MRVAAIGVGLAIASSGCAGSAEEPAVAATAMIDEAMGGTQAVQDFLLYVDMSAQTDDGSFSYYDEVLDRAAAALRSSP